MRKITRPAPDPAFLFRHGGQGPEGRDPAIDFSVSLNPLGPPGSVVEAVRSHLPDIARYPHPVGEPLVRCLAEYHGVQPRQVVVGNGSNDLIGTVPRAFPVRRVAVVEPTYTEYLRASLLAGADVMHWLADGPTFEPRPFDPEGAELVWLCNPNNPSGRLWPRGTLATWMADHPRTLFAVDEAFLPFLEDEADHTLIPAVDRLDNLIVLRSLTKVYTIPGLRLGYAMASPDRAERLRAHLGPWTVNALAEPAGRAAVGDRAFLARTHAWLRSVMPRFIEDLATVPAVEPIPSRSNFVLLRLRRGSAGWLTARLAARGFVVRDASNFLGLDGRYVRVAARTAEENRQLVEAVRAVYREA